MLAEVLWNKYDWWLSYWWAQTNRGIDKERLFHSDRESQYTSNIFEKILSDKGIKHSYIKKDILMTTLVWEASVPYKKKEEVNVNNYVTFNQSKMAILNL